MSTDPVTFTSGKAHATLLHPWHAPDNRALWVGLSGGIGVGKSTVAQFFVERGAVVADADTISREIVEPGGEGLLAITPYFPEAIRDNGTLDRAYLAHTVFSQPEQRELLESLLHPIIRRKAEEILRTAQPGELAVYDIPLLLETHSQSMFDCIVMIGAPMRERIARLTGNRCISEQSARARIEAQVGDEERKRVANWWIWNAGTSSDLNHILSKMYQNLF